MADDIHRNREAIEDLPIAIAEYHLDGVPEGIIVILTKMHRGIQRHSSIVDRVPLKDLCEKVESCAQPVISFIYRRVGGRGLTFAADDSSRQVLSVASRVDSTMVLQSHHRRRRGIPARGKPCRLGGEP